MRNSNLSSCGNLLPRVTQTTTDNTSLETLEIQRDADNAARRLLMAPYDKLVDKEEKSNAAKEDSQLSRIKLLQEKFKCATQQKVDGLLMDTSRSKDGTDAPTFGDDGIHAEDYDDEDKDFSYHSLDGSAEEEMDDHGEFGLDAVGTSPLAASAGGTVRKVDWLQEITRIQTYDKKDLLAAIVNQIFPCIACSDHKNTHKPSTWLPIFLRKLSMTT